MARGKSDGVYSAILLKSNESMIEDINEVLTNKKGKISQLYL